VTVIGYLELLQTDSAEQLGEEGHHYLERISSSARYMDSLIRDLLELSRIGRTQTETEPVQLQPIVEDIAAELRRTHQQARFEVVNVPDVVMNPVRARQLFTNLMENAVRHGGRDDITVRVSAGPGGSEFTSILVADDGAGIPPQYRERVFGIFERLDQEADTATVGTGIGLSMCRKIVEQVDGSLTIDDTETGTTFRISLPSAVMQSQKEVQRQ
jgi:signal transduction histidine kinase